MIKIDNNEIQQLRIVIFIFLFSVIPLLLFSQKIRSVEQDVIFLPDIEYKRLDTTTAHPSLGELIVLDTNFAILHLGFSEISTLDLHTGRISRTIDMDLLQQIISDTIARHDIDSLKIRETSDYEGVRVGEHFPILFNRIKKYDEGSFASLTFTGVSYYDDYDELRRMLLPGVLVFDNNLNILDFIPFKKNQDLRLERYMDLGGFYLDHDLLITEPIDTLYNHHMYVRYKRALDGFYHLADTFNHWSAFKSYGQETVIRDQFIAREDSILLPTKHNLIVFSDWNSEGYEKAWPIEENEYIQQINPMLNYHWYAANVYLDLSEKDGGLHQHSLHQLVVFNADFTEKWLITNYPVLDITINSISIAENKIYVLAFNRKKKEFIVLKYTLPDNFTNR